MLRAEWERTALARAIAVAVVRIRTDSGLSQRDLASVLGTTQPQVARQERGDVNPSMDTLVRVAAGLGIELTINVTPAPSQAASGLPVYSANPENFGEIDGLEVVPAPVA